LAFQEYFDLDIHSAMREQLVAAFEQLETAPLSGVEGLGVSRKGGVYGLYVSDVLVYIGKSGNLARRLVDHACKIDGRQNISARDVSFRCLVVNPNWSPFAPETLLLGHYGGDLAEWNGNGFGPHDPGRNREETDKPPDGFDQQYPIRFDFPCDEITAGTYDLTALLVALKKTLPFLFRYQTTDRKKYRAGHVGYSGKKVVVPRAGMPAHELLKLVTQQLPGWQSTRFPSHFILYEEQRNYRYGETIWYQPAADEAKPRRRTR
jgi:hypothetical protein